MKLELEVKRLNNEDVIATSAYKLSGLKDGIQSNIKFSGPTPNDATLFRSSAGGIYKTWSQLLYEEEISPSVKEFNGAYIWNETEQRYD